MAPNESPFHVLIIGAGMSGLTLAQQLKRNNISFSIYERDVEVDARSQGWALSLFGQALHDLETNMPSELGPVDQVNHLLPLDRPAQFCFYDITRPEMRVGVVSDDSGKIIRANRQRLRDWLMQGLEVQYSKKLVNVEENADKVTAHFEDGTIATGNFMVGAEGTRSAVRKYLLGGQDVMKPLALGSLAGEVALTGDEFEQQLSIAHSGYVVMDSTLGSDKQTAIFGALNRVSPDGKTGYYYFILLWVDREAPLTNDENPTWVVRASQEELAACAHEKTKSYPVPLRNLVEKVPVTGYRGGGFQLQDVQLESHQLPAGRVILIGDAAHSMTPFRGEAGVCAFTDAFKLGRIFEQVQQTNPSEPELKSLLEGFRDDMLARGKWATEVSNPVLEDYGRHANYQFGTFGKMAAPMEMVPATVAEPVAIS